MTLIFGNSQIVLITNIMLRYFEVHDTIAILGIWDQSIGTDEAPTVHQGHQHWRCSPPSCSYMDLLRHARGSTAGPTLTCGGFFVLESSDTPMEEQIHRSHRPSRLYSCN